MKSHVEAREEVWPIKGPNSRMDEPTVIRNTNSEIAIPHGVAPEEIEAVLLTGFGESYVSGFLQAFNYEGLTKLAVARLILPETELTPDTVKHSIQEGGREIVRELRGSEEPGGTSPWSKLLIGIGISKGGGEIVEIANSDPTPWSRIHPIQPLGFNNEQISTDPEGRLNKLWYRFLKEKRKQRGVDLITSNGLIAPAPEHDADRLVAEIAGGASYALHQNEAPGWSRKLYAARKMVKIIGGGNDLIFPGWELQESLGNKDMVEVIADLDHLALMTVNGIKKAAQIIRQSVPEIAPEPQTT